MNCFLLSAALMFPAFAQDSTQPGKDAKDGKLQIHKIEGEWNAVYVEIDGKKVENNKFAKVTIKNNVVTCQHDGKQMSWRLDFGPHHMVRATEQNGATSDPPEKGSATKGTHSHFGTYIASSEYFCLCLQKGADVRFPDRKEGAPREERQPQSTFEGHQPQGAGMVIILRRPNGTTEKTP